MTPLKTYLELCRISNLPTVWTNVLAAAVLSGAGLSLASYLPLALAMSCFYMAGMCFNDVCDRETDRLTQARRPLPSGRISLRRAIGLTCALFGLGLGLLGLSPHPLAMAAGLLLVGTIVFYDLHHKGNPFSVLVMATCRLLVFVVTALALSGQLNTWVLLAGGVQFGYVVLISLVARHENQSAHPFAFPVIPAMLAGISLLDGLLLAGLAGWPWLGCGVAGAALTWLAQRYVRGD